MCPRGALYWEFNLSHLIWIPLKPQLLTFKVATKVFCKSSFDLSEYLFDQGSVDHCFIILNIAVLRTLEWGHFDERMIKLIVKGLLPLFDFLCLPWRTSRVGCHKKREVGKVGRGLTWMQRNFYFACFIVYIAESRNTSAFNDIINTLRVKEIFW